LERTEGGYDDNEDDSNGGYDYEKHLDDRAKHMMMMMMMATTI
jgi:hypothetical protein